MQRRCCADSICETLPVCVCLVTRMFAFRDNDANRFRVCNLLLLQVRFQISSYILIFTATKKEQREAVLLLLKTQNWQVEKQ
jgi:hypothetical protein